MVEYFAKVPNPKEGRRTFSILKRKDRKKSERVELDRVKAINHLFKEGTQDFKTCKKQILQIVKELRDRERPDPGEVYLDSNIDILDRYWEKYYTRRRIDASSKLAFTTGMRLGEIFGATSYNGEGQCVPVFTQIDIHGKRKETKTRVKRFASVEPAGIDWVKKWLTIENSTKQAFRGLKFSEITKRACRKVFPHDSEKWCRFHDLRHSYAIHCLGKGVPIDFVALSLGNSVQVCQKYYVGFTLTPFQTQVMKGLLNGKTQRAA